MVLEKYRIFPASDDSGGIVSSQAWALRRMISVYNAIARRPHVPRERALRLLMQEQGLDVIVDPPRPAKGASGSGGPGEEPEGEPEGESEDGDDESEDESDATTIYTIYRDDSSTSTMSKDMNFQYFSWLFN